ncbi:hypothetical protein ENUP19_0263G0041 [Entamoeba nuttalli]|uniref:PWWP domain-containing protein n=2 Tax=Entamoeba nuttalli TaxID=412467 RepID=K2GWY4_ENTNP|nr:hypothetical protein ENU1_170530 [Entamoeba nuttalli P19]EKE38302.1 hypothetical protein ENU1_170530 [Entamoeba nuttalli P19]|eukprot:XP_008859360.1 hypothetical protein ENU1_170530 [Entamoeba nuttalli P19]
MEEEKQVDTTTVQSSTPPMSPQHSHSITPSASPKENKVSTPLSPNKEDGSVATPTSRKKEEETKPKKSPNDSVTVIDKEIEQNKWDNWSVVWVKQKGYPWWPAKIIIMDKLNKKKKGQLEKLIEFKRDKKYLVKYITNGYEFGWVNDNQIKPFKEEFMNIITERMLGKKDVVESINKAIEITNDKISENDIDKFHKAVIKKEKQMEEEEKKKEKMRNCDIGFMVVNDPMIEITKIEGVVEKNIENNISSLQKLKNWKEMDHSQVIEELNTLMKEPIMIHEIINPINKIGELLNSICQSTNIEISVLAERVLERIKKELKYAIISGEYQRCKEIFN